MRGVQVAVMAVMAAWGCAGIGQAPAPAAPAPAAVQSAPAAPAAPAAAPAAPAAPAQTAETKLEALQARMQDWAQLGYYAAKNASLPAAAPDQKRVVFYGDSITQGWGRPSNWFPAEKPYVDRGISGQTSAQMVVRFHPDVVDLQPAVVVILAGTNDVAENTGPMPPKMTLDNIRAMVEMAKANGIKVVVGSILPAAEFPWRKGLEPAPKIKALNDRLRAYCESAGVVWVDYYTPLDDGNGGIKAGLSLDGVHPTKAGYDIMAPIAEAGIAKALAK